MPTAHTDHPSDRHELDYDLADAVEATTPAQLKAVADETRTAILSLLLERAATTTQLADAMEKPRGTVGYHLKILEEAGLVRVVRRRKVRALTEKYYGRTARTIVLKGLPDEQQPFFMLEQAQHEARIVPEAPLPMFTLRRARMSEERALEFSKRVVRLAEEFASAERSGSRVYGFVAGVYPTDLPTLASGDREVS